METERAFRIPAKTGSARQKSAGLLLVAALTPVLSACSGVQSALDPAGDESGQVARLFWVMIAGGLQIWTFVVALSLYASRWKREPLPEDKAARVIFWGGAMLPVTVLAALLAYALWLMPSLRPIAGSDDATLRIEVTGRQFWWHVVYQRPNGVSVVSANEIRLPVGERVEFALTSTDMIHSFWIPALGGKMDLIPGRQNRLSLKPTKVGTYRGQCAEFCGTSHALMAFPAIVMEGAAFDAWLNARSRPSSGVEAPGMGRALFERERCGSCHRIAGTPWQATAGPDLSHVGSRLTVGAGQLASGSEALASFIADASAVKAGAHMPANSHLSAAELTEIATWLKGLQ
ncbi:cytochrome c oxidase subunit II [Aminobacter aminovorans]|jgi:cytochrome c oxidase subunit 2|uniref:Cytochrome aa3 subunit 2 n=1 Tax=Aminobacter aminovorans TaxID=83263 RepID=A0AAC8YVV5_AMIAI|nr:cytochrome c oxidase subunit II [Aminobacter aminovorans]AMS45249.1 Cytochrome c oxidase subunit II [Aminobacter aminovorans]MBB3704987.1 cytochrome c oxidase subunit 2 [Aminobacter aminovorans]